MNLSECAAIVTGSSSVTGIGAECAKALAGRGCNVVINYNSNEEGAKETAAACEALGVETLVFQGSVADDDSCRAMVEAAMDKWGRLDALVNNAATTKPIKHRDLHLLDADEFIRIYKVNVIGTYQMIRAALPHLKASGDGAVVNIGSTAVWRASGSSIAYCASKGALSNITLSLARVLAPEVRINTVCPGGLLGNWTRSILTEAEYQERVREAEEDYLLKKPIWPADVAATALWLVEGATHMTGESVRMDVGRHLQ
ncbi:MAG: SDR family oxidoreductase [Alphaproteobacteria bacterium]|nr:SDR family oxidoreductase [Alphaproteobacteria bacterium]